MSSILDVKFDKYSILWFFVITYVLIDCITGFTVQQIGIDLKLSQLLKVALFVTFVIYVIEYNVKLSLLLVFLLLWLLVNPTRMVFSYNSFNALSYDFPAALRVFMIILSPVFFVLFAKQNHDKFLVYARRTMHFSFVVICLNILSGYLGFGFHTYPVAEVGFKGFFFAGNELSALFILFSSFFLFEVWEKKGISISYFIWSVFVLFTGYSIGTKTGAFFGLISVFMIPLASYAAKGNGIKVLSTIVFSSLVLVISFYLMFSLIQNTVLYEKFSWILENRGLSGLIFSGRDRYLFDFFDRMDNSQGILSFIFGIGSGVPQYQFKTIEIDFFDLVMYFGIPTAFLYFIFAIFSVLAPLILLTKRPYAPVLLVVNFTFLFLSFLSGHIWTSGMLGIGWGVFNAFLVIKEATPNSPEFSESSDGYYQYQK